MAPIKKPQRQRLRHFIKEWRDYRGLTQEQVADRIGVSGTTFGRIEGNKTPYNQDFLELTADALRCDPWDLLHVNPTKEGDVVDLMRHLDDRQRLEAAEFMRYLAQKKATNS